MCVPPPNASGANVPLPSVARASNAGLPTTAGTAAPSSVVPPAAASGSAPPPPATSAAAVATPALPESSSPQTAVSGTAPAEKPQTAQPESPFLQYLDKNKADFEKKDDGTTENGDASTGFETTHYGYKDDPYLDSETAKGNGKFGKLTPGKSVALTDSMAAKIGAKPNDEIAMQDAKGNQRLGTYDDRAPESNDRIDIYDPHGSEKAGSPFNAVSARVNNKKVASAAQTLYPKG